MCAVSLPTIVHQYIGYFLGFEIGRGLGAKLVEPALGHISREAEKTLHVSAKQTVVGCEELIQTLYDLLFAEAGRMAHLPSTRSVDIVVFLFEQLPQEFLVGGEANGLYDDIVARDF